MRNKYLKRNRRKLSRRRFFVFWKNELSGQVFIKTEKIRVLPKISVPLLKYNLIIITTVELL